MSTNALRNILVIGATGAIGKPIFNQILLAKSSFDRVALLTSQNTVSSKAAELEALKKRGAEVLVGDLSNEDDVKKAYKDIDTVISAVGRGAIETQIQLIKWASETPSVTRFFPSEYGTDIEHNAQSPKEKPHQLKLKVRAYARSIKPENLHFTYLVTGPYSDMWMAKMPRDEIGTFDVKGKRAVLFGDGEGKIAFTAMADVGKLVVAALTHPKESEDKILIVNSFTTTPNEVLKEFERQTGSKWDVKYIPVDELKKNEKAAWEAGEPWATGLTLRRIWTEGGTLYSKPRDNGIIGEPKTETLEEQVRQVIETQMKG